MFQDLAQYSQMYYSQFGEAGIIDRILAIIGTKECVALEFGAHNGMTDSNTRHLLERGWRVVMWDGSHDNGLVHRERITAENINELMAKYDIPVELDLLSLDIDGNEYWIWRALTARPRLLVVEFNGALDPTAYKTIPYDPAFVWDGTDYHGASLPLLVQLGMQKGYTLIYQHVALNAFFVRNDLLTAPVPPISYEPQIRHPPDRSRPWCGG